MIMHDNSCNSALEGDNWKNYSWRKGTWCIVLPTEEIHYLMFSHTSLEEKINKTRNGECK